MHIAIIGAGFAGLATAYYLLEDSKHKNIQVTLFDANGIGGGASGIAAGLMHPYAGAHAKVNWRGFEGFAASMELLDLASDALKKKVYSDSGILRIAISEKQKSYFKDSANKNEGVKWLEADECAQMVPGVVAEPGIFIKEAVSVYCPLYIEGLWKLCSERGALLVERHIDSLDELKAFDRVIVAAGPNTCSIKGLEKLPVNRLKGQILEFDWPEGLEPLKIALNSEIYIVMSEDNRRVIVGSTFERDYESDEVDAAFAMSEIMPKLAVLYPPLAGLMPVSCRSGIRATAPLHLPLVKWIDERCVVFTGLGSKGLLYHALLAKDLGSSAP
jgi:glycine/D-amino acid oxidase-like deaminating enzyme